MRRNQIIACILVFLLLFVRISTAGADWTGVTFVSINDGTLELYTSAVWDERLTVNGSYVYVKYVPSSFFSRAAGITWYFNEETGYVEVTHNNVTVYFDMWSDAIYDPAGGGITGYPVRYSSNQLYLPVEMVCAMFNIRYAYFTGEGYGALMRIYTDSILEDEAFYEAAKPNMRERYNNAFRPVTPTPEMSPEVSLTPVLRTEVSVYLSFVGLPTTELLDVLDGIKYRACFFLRAEDVRDGRDRLRRILASGHSVGVYCGADAMADYIETRDLIYDAARTLTILVTSDPENYGSCADAAEANALVYWNSEITGAGRSTNEQIRILEQYAERAGVMLPSGEADAVRPFLDELLLRRYNVKPPSEIWAYI